MNSCKRVAGLSLLGQVLNLSLPLDLRQDAMNWFSSSLRGNKNFLTHYLEDITGCGMHVESHARKHFFVIINGLVTYLKKATDENEIKAILNALKWKYSARDHTFLNKM